MKAYTAALIEAGARAQCFVSCCDSPHGPRCESPAKCWDWKVGEPEARACLAAVLDELMEPSEEMVRAGNQHTHCGASCGHRGAVDCLRAMLAPLRRDLEEGGQ